MTARQDITTAWYSIVSQCGYEQDDCCYNLSDKPEVARKIGKAVYDYMTASTYDMDWEGFSSLELRGIAALLKDLDISVRNT